MPGAKLGAAVILACALTACSDPAPPAGIVHHEARVSDATPSTATTEVVQPPEAATEPPEPLEVTTTTAYDWGPVLCERERHPAHHKPCPVQGGPPLTKAPYRAPAVVSAPVEGSGACGGDLPPCSVMRRESGGDPTAIGYGQCGRDNCYGKWQVDPDTAESVGYPRRLDLEPESVQDDAARAILARDGCGAWSTC